ncbi:Mechanosensitive ion channel protein [Klebsormidium nitens]|uniref:Mechanosensitive ion channel protein n=1 Tax=Klebsormidium nitens TaxID=105231 RepID=A0A1Y1HZC6_KLENI|nr:Mechanosensitive ion channel protein [Klebsormidium nitens]|eukprot:GAQ81887.1 Mechanosensitive ion channel protein [Klebsormidium nitens]
MASAGLVKGRLPCTRDTVCSLRAHIPKRGNASAILCSGRRQTPSPCQIIKQVLPSSFLHARSQPFLPPRPNLPCLQQAPSQQRLLNHTPRTRQIRAHAPAGAAARPVAPIDAAKGTIEGFNAWLQKSHSTELTRWLEARGIVLPDFFAWLPQPLHNRLHHIEDELGIFTQEIILALLVLLFIRELKNVLYFFHDKWYNVLHKKQTDVYMTHKRKTFEHTVFGALEGPLSAATFLLWASHVYTVIAPLLHIKFSTKAIAVYREVSIIGVLTWFALNWKNNIIGELKARSSEQSTKAQLGALDKLATILIVSFGIMVTGEIAGYAFKSILALGGVSGIAISLAARDVVSNMFGGTMLYLTRPFAQGDTIKAGNVNGQVVDIGFYSTKVMTPDKQPTYVPNAYFTNQVITNYSRATNRVLNAVFTLRHQDLVKVDHIVDQIRDLLSSHQSIDLQSSVNVNLVNVTPYNLEIQINAVTRPNIGGGEFNRAKHDIFIRIAQIIDQAGARLSPYPDQPYPPIPIPAK